MKTKGTALGSFFLILMLLLLGFSLYFLYLNLPKEPQELTLAEEFQSVPADNLEGYSLTSKQFYQKMRYRDRNIGYYIFSSCDGKKAELMLEAFSKIESLTSIDFYPSRENPEISVLCSNLAPEADEVNHFVAGEGGPSEVLNTSIYSVILKGKIALYRDDRCSESKIAVHELLHALGFDHNNNPTSIMYPTLDCGQTIDEQIIEDINILYTADSMPDLLIYEVKASKGGRYLNFDIEVLNSGLKDADNVKLSIYSENNFVRSFNLDKVEIGSKKILNVENLRVPYSSDKITFVVDEENKIPELFENNNRVELVLSA